MPGEQVHAAIPPLVTPSGAPSAFGLLVASRAPHHHLLGALVKTAVYMGLDRTSTPVLADISGPLRQQIEEALAWAEGRTGVVVNTRLPLGQHNQPRISRDALREAIVNALAHRDYGATDFVYLDLFTDRLEISSPGNPPGGLGIDLAHPPPTRWRNTGLRHLLEREGFAQLQRRGLEVIHKEVPGATILAAHGVVTVTLPLLHFRGTAASVGLPRVAGSPVVIAVSLAMVSIRVEVERNLEALGLGGQEVQDLHEPVEVLEAADTAATVERLATAAFSLGVRPGTREIHLFLRCPLSVAGAITAALTRERTVVLYQRGSTGYYFVAAVLDRTFFGKVEASSRA